MKLAGIKNDVASARFLATIKKAKTPDFFPDWHQGKSKEIIAFGRLATIFIPFGHFNK